MLNLLNKIIRNGKSVSIITAVGRKEPNYLRSAGNSIVELSNELPNWKIQWFLAVDGIDPRWVQTTTADLNIPKKIIGNVDAEPGRGPSFPRNRALRKVTSKWLLNLDDDDVYNSKTMAELLTLALQKNAIWAAGKVAAINAIGNFIGDNPGEGRPIALDNEVPIGSLKNRKIQHGRFPFHCSATVVQTKVAKELGGWVEDPILARYEDIALWTKINDRYPGIILQSTVLYYRKHQSSFTKQSYWNNLPDRYDLIDQYLEA